MKTDYNKAAEYCKENWSEMSDKVILIADKACENKFMFDMAWDMERVDEVTDFKEKVDWFHKKNGDPEFMFQLNRHHYFISLAQAYRMTGDEKYVLKLKELMTDWIKNVKCPERNSVHPWRSLETGLRGENWTLAVDIVKDCPLIDEEFMAMYHESLHVHAKALLRFYSMNNYLSNWGVMESHGLFDIGLELENKEYISTALERLYAEADIQVMADGVHWEQSCLYHNEVLKFFLDVIIRARKNGIELESRFLESVRRLAMVNVYWIKPNFKNPLFGDSDYNDIRDILTKSALVFGDGVMKSLAFEKPDFETVWLLGVQADDEYRKIKPQKPDFASVALTDSGNYIMRSSFETDSNYLCFRNGYTGAGHAHEDKLSFEFSIGQDDILVDCGRYTYVWNREREHLKSYMAHNTVCVDESHFIKPSGWNHLTLAPTVKGNFFKNEKFEFLNSAHLGYFGAKTKDPVFVSRSIAWLKDDIYIIIDEFDSHKKHKYSQYFNFAPEGKLEPIDGQTVVFHADNSDAFIKFFAEGLTYEIEPGLYSHHYNQITETKTLKTSFKGMGKTAAVTVIASNQKNKYKSISAERIDVFCDDRKTKIDLPDAMGLRITLDDEEHTVILSFKELMKVMFCDSKPASAKVTWYKEDEYTAAQW